MIFGDTGRREGRGRGALAASPCKGIAIDACRRSRQVAGGRSPPHPAWATHAYAWSCLVESPNSAFRGPASPARDGTLWSAALEEPGAPALTEGAMARVGTGAAGGTRKDTPGAWCLCQPPATRAGDEGRRP